MKINNQWKCVYERTREHLFDDVLRNICWLCRVEMKWQLHEQTNTNKHKIQSSIILTSCQRLMLMKSFSPQLLFQCQSFNCHLAFFRISSSLPSMIIIMNVNPIRLSICLFVYKVLFKCSYRQVLIILTTLTDECHVHVLSIQPSFFLMKAVFVILPHTLPNWPDKPESSRSEYPISYYLLCCSLLSKATNGARGEGWVMISNNVYIISEERG